MSRCHSSRKKRHYWHVLTAVLLLCAFFTLMMGFYISGALEWDWFGFVGVFIASGLVFFANQAWKEGRG